MKATRKLDGLKARLAFIVAVIFAVIFVACEKENFPVDNTEKEPKVEVSDISASDYNDIEINSQIIDYGDQPILSMGVCWATTKYSTIQNQSISKVNLDKSKFTVKIEDLPVDSVYYFRAFVSTELNTYYSYPREFSCFPEKTKALVGVITNIATTSVSTFPIVIPNSPDAKANLELCEVGTNKWKRLDLNLNLQEVINWKDSIKLSYDISELKPNTEYYLRIRSSNLAGETISGNRKFKTFAVMDIDGNGYYEVTIGTQTWLQQNLKTTRYANGDKIPYVKGEDWTSLTSSAYCYYNDDPALGEIYGALYPFYVAQDKRALIEGYHVPSDDEWGELTHFGNSSKAAFALSEAGTEHWLESGSSDYVTNSSGFTALPGGVLNGIFFSDLGKLACFWTSNTFHGYANFVEINPGWLQVNLANHFYYGYSIRLLKD